MSCPKNRGHRNHAARLITDRSDNVSRAVRIKDIGGPLTVLMRASVGLVWTSGRLPTTGP